MGKRPSDDNDLTMTYLAKHISEMNISQVFKDLDTTESTMRAFSPKRETSGALDFSKIDISKIPLDLLTNNVEYLQNISTVKDLPAELKDILEDHTRTEEKHSNEVKSPKSGGQTPQDVAFKSSDSFKVDNDEVLGSKLREVFQSRNSKQDSKINFGAFINGLELLGLDIKEGETRKIFADFLEGNNTEVEIEKVISDIHKDKTDRIHALRAMIEQILGISSSPVRELQFQLEVLTNQVAEKSYKILKL